jgi:hypothetical protein
MGWTVFGEAIEMLARRHGYFPLAFRWRGQRFKVEAVERCWTVVHRSRRDRVERRFFRVRCVAGSFELYQDLVDGTWHLRRAKLGRASGPVGRRAMALWRRVPAWQ